MPVRLPRPRLGHKGFKTAGAGLGAWARHPVAGPPGPARGQAKAVDSLRGRWIPGRRLLAAQAAHRLQLQLPTVPAAALAREAESLSFASSPKARPTPSREP